MATGSGPGADSTTGTNVLKTPPGLGRPAAEARRVPRLMPGPGPVGCGNGSLPPMGRGPCTRSSRWPTAWRCARRPTLAIPLPAFSPSSRRRSVSDLEAREIWIRIDLVDFNRGDRRAAGPTVEKRHELIDGVGRSLSPHPNGSVGLVPHPTFHAEVSRTLPGRIAEADALDTTSDNGGVGHRHRRPSTASSTNRQCRRTTSADDVTCERGIPASGG